MTPTPRRIPVRVLVELVGGEHDGARIHIVTPLPPYIYTMGQAPDTMLYTVLAEVMAEHSRLMLWGQPRGDTFDVYRREVYTDYLNDVTRYILEREAS